MKNYSQAVKDALRNQQPITDLITMNLTSGVVRLTTAGHDIVYEGLTYLSNSLILSVDGIKQQQELRVTKVNIQFTAVDQSILAVFLNQTQQNRRVTVNRVILTPEHTVVGSLLITQFLIDSDAVDDTEESCVVNVTLSNYVADFESVRGIRTTQNSFRRFYPNSTAFINSKDNKKDLKWGGK